MPQVLVDSTKGLFQQSGTGFVGVPAQLNTLTGDAETITVDGLVVRLDGNGARNECILSTSGAVAGQIAILLNEGGEGITFNAAATSNVFGTAAETLNTIAPGCAIIVVYDDTNSRWVVPSSLALMTNVAS